MLKHQMGRQYYQLLLPGWDTSLRKCGTVVWDLEGDKELGQSFVVGVDGRGHSGQSFLRASGACHCCLQGFGPAQTLES